MGAERARGNLQLTPASLAVVDGDRAAKVPWIEVRRVVAYKRDLLTTDLICLRFETGTELVEIHEELEGWAAVLGALPSHLPGCWPQSRILGAVVKPAFQANETVIYEAQGTDA